MSGVKKDGSIASCQMEKMTRTGRHHDAQSKGFESRLLGGTNPPVPNKYAASPTHTSCSQGARSKSADVKDESKDLSNLAKHRRTHIALTDSTLPSDIDRMCWH